MINLLSVSGQKLVFSGPQIIIEGTMSHATKENALNIKNTPTPVTRHTTENNVYGKE